MNTKCYGRKYIFIKVYNRKDENVVNCQTNKYIFSAAGIMLPSGLIKMSPHSERSINGDNITSKMQ